MILAVLSTLAEPTRLAAILMLHDGPEHCVREFMRSPDATQSRMSRRMQVLKQARLVVDRSDAQWVRYRLNPDLFDNIRILIAAALTEEITA